MAKQNQILDKKSENFTLKLSNFLNFLSKTSLQKTFLQFYTFVVLVLAVCTFFVNYTYPPLSQWDEVYHVASAEKYLQGVMFMEPHPPLGKLFIALGENIIRPNVEYQRLSLLASFCFTKEELDFRKNLGKIDTEQFARVDVIGQNNTDWPQGFSFCGYRFFPVLFSVLIAPIFLWILYLLLRNIHLAFLFSLTYIFDNALILQSRAAMLEPTQIFFLLLSILYFLWLIIKIFKTQQKNLQASKNSTSALFNYQEIDTNLQQDNLEIIKANQSQLTWKNYAILGALVGLTIAVKHNGAIILLLPLFWLIWEGYLNKKILDLEWLEILFTQNYKQKTQLFRQSLKNFWRYKVEIIAKLGSFVLSVFLVYLGVFVIHFNLGTRIEYNNNNNNGKYQASAQYLKILEDKQTWNPLNWYVMLRDNLNYMNRYHKGIPKLDLTKEGENGSYPMNWPVMNKTINFRSARTIYHKDDPQKIISIKEYDALSKEEKKEYIDVVRYSTLIGNPLVWFLGVLGVLLSLVLIFGHLIFDLKIKNWRTFGFIAIFTILYLSYMFAILQIERVMYLYHYFIPLLFSLILFVLMVDYLFKDYLNFQFKEEGSIVNYLKIPTYLVSYGLIFSLVLGIIVCWFIFAPFTYYQPLTREEFLWRNWFSFWGMKVLN